MVHQRARARPGRLGLVRAAPRRRPRAHALPLSPRRRQRGSVQRRHAGQSRRHARPSPCRRRRDRCPRMVDEPARRDALSVTLAHHRARPRPRARGVAARREPGMDRAGSILGRRRDRRGHRHRPGLRRARRVRGRYGRTRAYVASSKPTTSVRPVRIVGARRVAVDLVDVARAISALRPRAPGPPRGCRPPPASAPARRWSRCTSGAPPRGRAAGSRRPGRRRR